MGRTLTDEDLDAIAVRVVKIMAARLTAQEFSCLTKKLFL